MPVEAFDTSNANIVNGVLLQACYIIAIKSTYHVVSNLGIILLISIVPTTISTISIYNKTYITNSYNINYRFYITK